MPLVLALAVGACSGGGDPSAGRTACPADSRDRTVPRDGVMFGVNLDWGELSIEQYAERTRRDPAAAVVFSGFPMTDEERHDLDGAVSQLEPTGAVLLLTLEPYQGLAAITEEQIDDLAVILRGAGDRGVPVILRLAHEMNGSWYAWGQQPAAYVDAFRRVAATVHADAPGTAMMWAPNYGGGYPFAGGEFAPAPGTDDFALLDTDGSRSLTSADDPYAPYYPGDDAVDWVGMSLYHWGSDYPWGENEVPEEGKFVSQLTGTYDGLGGDDRAAPDFYADYAVAHGKPLAVPETAALVHPLGDDAGELLIKQAWWRQVFSDEVHERFPELKLISWFEWDKTEVEIDGRVDWTVTRSSQIRRAFTADLPVWLLGADQLPRGC